MRGRGAGAKSAPQEVGPTPNFPRPFRNRALQTIIVLKKWQIRPRPLRVCVNITAVAERECLNPPVSAPQPPRAYVNVALLVDIALRNILGPFQYKDRLSMYEDFHYKYEAI